MKKLILFGIIGLMSITTTASTLSKVDQTIPVKEDTYIATDNARTNYGSDKLMKPKATKTFNRIGLMKFQIPEAEIKSMTGAQAKIAITFGSGSEEANYSVYAFHNLKWSENDATYEKLEKEITLNKGVKLGEIEFKKDSANEPKYYYINITEFVKKHGKNEFTLMITDEKIGNKNLNIRTKEHSEKWTPAIEIQR